MGIYLALYVASLLFALALCIYLNPLKSKVYEMDREIGEVKSDVSSIKSDVGLIKETILRTGER